MPSQGARQSPGTDLADGSEGSEELSMQAAATNWFDIAKSVRGSPALKAPAKRSSAETFFTLANAWPANDGPGEEIGDRFCPGQ
jgi:hypothetical protein